MAPTDRREITFHVRRRALTDPYVRFILLCGMALLVLSAGMFADKCWRRWEDSRLIHSGAVVDATVGDGLEIHVSKGQFIPYGNAVQIEYTWQGRTYRTIADSLPGRFARGSVIPIHVNPDRPSIWTARTELGPMHVELVGSAIALLAGIIVVLWGIVSWRRVLNTWQNATTADAVVIAARHTALAPHSWSVDCHLVEDGAAQVYHVFAPAAPQVEAGSLISILMPANRGRPLVGSWFE